MVIVGVVARDYRENDGLEIFLPAVLICLNDKLDFEDEEKWKKTPISFGNGLLVVLFNKMWKTNEGAGMPCVRVCVC